MALETADMVAQLTSLRAAMAKEKMKREQALGAARSGSSIWANGAAGLSSSKGSQSSQHTTPHVTCRSSRSTASTPALTPASSSRASSATKTVPPKGPAPTLSADRAPARFLNNSGLRSGLGISPEADAAEAGRQADTGPERVGGSLVLGIGTTRKVQSMAAAAAAAATTSRLLSPACVAAVSHAAVSAAATSSSQHTSSMDGSDSVIGHSRGYGCGAEVSLLHGEYNEAASRSSFLDALNEWRRAGASATTSSAAGNQATSSVATGEQSAGSSMDVQTDSNRPDSVCSKNCLLRLNSSSSGTAVSSVGGCYLMKMLARSSNSGSREMPTCSRNDAVMHVKHLHDKQQQDQQDAGAEISGKEHSRRLQRQQQPSSHANASLDASLQVGPPTTHDEDEDEDSDICAPDGSEVTSCFNAWLVSAEQHAEQAVACSGIAGMGGTADGSSCVSSGTQASSRQHSALTEPKDNGPGGDDRYPLVTAAAMDKAVLRHEQQLNSVLHRLEALEAMHSITLAVKQLPGEPRPTAIVQGAAVKAGPGVVHFTSSMRLPDAVHVPLG